MSAAVFALSGCGDEAPVDAQSPASGSPADTTAASPRERAASATEPAAPPAATTVEIDALIDTVIDSDADDRAQRAALDRLVSLGEPALVRALDRSEEFVYGSEDPVRAFEADAVPHLLRRLDSEDDGARYRAMNELASIPAFWAYGDQGPAICRALAVHLTTDASMDPALDALRHARPAVAVVGKELAEAWFHEPRWSNRELLDSLLEESGPDAAAACPRLWDVLLGKAADGSRGEDDPTDVALRVAAARVLFGIGLADPSRLPDLQRLLDDSESEVRWEALCLLAQLGDDAAPAVPRLLAFLEDDPAAAHALLAIPSAADVAWRAAARIGDSETLERLLADPARRGRVVDALPGCTVDEIGTVLWTLGVDPTFDVAGLVNSLLAQKRRAPRIAALDHWRRLRGDEPPAVADAWLDDADPEVRLAAARVLDDVERVSPERIRAVALPLTNSEDAALRADAVALLRHSAGHDEESWAAVLRALGDSDRHVREAARDAVLVAAASSDTALDVLRTELAGAEGGLRLRQEVARRAPRDERCLGLVLEILGGRDLSAITTVLGTLRQDDVPRFQGPQEALRARLTDLALGGGDQVDESALWTLRTIDGWPESVLAVFGSVLRRDDAGGSRADRLLQTLPTYGQGAVELRPALERLATSLGPAARVKVQEVLREMERQATPVRTPAEDLARRADRLDDVDTLLALGEPGRRAVPLLARRRGLGVPIDDLLARLAEVPLDDVVRESLREPGSGPDADERREGAVLLTPLLPDRNAVALLAEAASDDDVRACVLESLARIERRRPGAVPAELAVRLLHAKDGSRTWDASPLAEAIGRRYAEADPEVLPELRAMRDSGRRDLRAAAACALWHLTRDPDEAAPTLREILGHPGRLLSRERPPWPEIATTLMELPVGPADVAAVVETLRAAASPGRGSAGGPFLGAPRWLAPWIERVGPAAAPAVAPLRVALGRWTDDGTRHSESGIVAHALGAIGPAAREALPDLRRWAKATGDPDGVAREAIQAIEAARR